MPSKRQTLRPNQIRRYRRKRDLKLRQIFKLMGLRSVSHLSHWEKGRKIPSLANALKLSAIIQCPVEVLFLELFNTIRRDVSAKKHALTERKHAA